MRFIIMAKYVQFTLLGVLQSLDCCIDENLCVFIFYTEITVVQIIVSSSKLCCVNIVNTS